MPRTRRSPLRRRSRRQGPAAAREQGQGEHGARRCPARDPQDVRIGEIVAKHDLHGDACHRERSADDRRQQHARRPKRRDHVVAPQQRRDGIATPPDDPTARPTTIAAPQRMASTATVADVARLIRDAPRSPGEGASSPSTLLIPPSENPSGITMTGTSARAGMRPQPGPLLVDGAVLLPRR